MWLSPETLIGKFPGASAVKISRRFSRKYAWGYPIACVSGEKNICWIAKVHKNDLMKDIRKSGLEGFASLVSKKDDLLFFDLKVEFLEIESAPLRKKICTCHGRFKCQWQGRKNKIHLFESKNVCKKRVFNFSFDHSYLSEDGNVYLVNLKDGHHFKEKLFVQKVKDISVHPGWTAHLILRGKRELTYIFPDLKSSLNRKVESFISTPRDVEEIVATESSCILSTEGEIYCMGKPNARSPLIKVKIPPVKSLFSNRCAVTMSNDVYCWSLHAPKEKGAKYTAGPVRIE